MECRREPKRTKENQREPKMEIGGAEPRAEDGEQRTEDGGQTVGTWEGGKVRRCPIKAESRKQKAEMKSKVGVVGTFWHLFPARVRKTENLRITNPRYSRVPLCATRV